MDLLRSAISPVNMSIPLVSVQKILHHNDVELLEKGFRESQTRLRALQLTYNVILDVGFFAFICISI